MCVWAVIFSREIKNKIEWNLVYRKMKYLYTIFYLPFLVLVTSSWTQQWRKIISYLESWFIQSWCIYNYKSISFTVMALQHVFLTTDIFSNFGAHRRHLHIKFYFLILEHSANVISACSFILAYLWLTCPCSRKLLLIVCFWFC